MLNRMTQKNNGIKGYIGVLVFINVFCFMIAGGNLKFSQISDRMDKYTENWDTVDVTIDDVKFEYDGSETERDSDGHSKKIYNFHMDRILKYTYKGEYYEVNNKITYEKNTRDFYVEPSTGYKDNRVYKVNPSSPRSVSVSYSDVPDSVAKGLKTVNKVIAFLAIGVAVVADIVVVVKIVRKKKVKFEDE